jgi:hypothetical protein
MKKFNEIMITNNMPGQIEITGDFSIQDQEDFLHSQLTY